MEFQRDMEDVLSKYELIRYCVVVGQDRPYLSALIVPEQDELCKRLTQDGAELGPLHDLDVRGIFCDLIHEANKQYPGDKKLERFALVTAPPDVGAPEPVRHLLCAGNRKILESFYREIPPGVG